MPPHSNEILQIVLLDIVLRTLYTTSNAMVRATGKVKWYEIGVNIITLVFFALIYLSFRFDFGITGPFICIFLSSLTSLIYMSYMSCKVIGMPWGRYLWDVCGRMLLSYGVLLGAMMWYTCSNEGLLVCPTFGNFAWKALAAMFIVGLSEYFLGFNGYERSFVKGAVRKIFGRA